MDGRSACQNFLGTLIILMNYYFKSFFFLLKNGLPRHGFDLGRRAWADVGFSASLSASLIIFRPVENRESPA